MRVTLAYPYAGHQPDETVNLDDRTARLLIREGRARVPAKGARTSTTRTRRTPPRAATAPAPPVTPADQPKEVTRHGR